MSEIAPAILTDSDDAYKERIESLHPFAQRVHIDISDGEFAPTLTISPAQIWWPETWRVDIHAMVMRPSEYVDAMIQLKPHMVIFHAEIEEDLVPVLKKLQQNDIKAGVALMRPTVPLSVRNLIEESDHVMIFSGELGKHGGTASLMQLEKVRLIKAIRPTVEIGWDGGVTVENAFSLAQGGVSVLNVGATIAKSAEPQKAYATLVNEINKHGVI